MDGVAVFVSLSEPISLATALHHGVSHGASGDDSLMVMLLAMLPDVSSGHCAQWCDCKPHELSPVLSLLSGRYI